MQDLVAIRHDYETQAQAFLRGHNTVVALVCVCCMVLILSRFYWLSLFTFLTGALIIYILKMKQLAAQRQIASIDCQIRQKSLQVLGSAISPHD